MLGAGVVAGQREDGGGQHDADHHRQRGEDRRAHRGLHPDPELGPLAGQVDEGQQHRADGADGGRDVEGSVDGGQAALAGPRLAQVDAGHRRQGADGGDQQRVDQALVAEGLRAEDQRRDQGDGVGLEEVGGHTGAVADVVTDVVGDGGGVARVVLGDVVLDLADQVGAHVGGLGEDAAADPHEHRQQRGAEAEALEHLGCVVLEEDHHEARAQQAQADRQHAHGGAGAEADVHRGVAALRLRRSGHAQVGLHREVHAEVAHGRGEAGTAQEGHGAEDPHHGVVGRQQQQREERDAREDGEGAELAGQVGGGSFLDRPGDGLHVVGALSGGEDLLPEHRCHRERAERDQCDDDDQDEVPTGDGHDSGNEPRHLLPPATRSCGAWSPHVTQVSRNEADSTQIRPPEGTPM